MFINPKIAIEKGWIQGITNPDKQVQPNAIDFTLDELRAVLHGNAVVSETNKQMRQLSDKMVPDENGFWTLRFGQVYDGTSLPFVNVPEGVAAVLYTRSTLARNGVFLMSGLYDSGYQGHIGFTLYPIAGNISIQEGTRVGQIAFLSAESAKMYAGGYNHSAGTHYTETKDPQ